MKKVTITSIVLFIALLASACSAPIAQIQGQAAEALQSAAEALEQPSTQTDMANNTQKSAQQAASPTPPAAPPVSLSGDRASVLAAYEGVLTSVYETVSPSVVNIRVVQKSSGLGSNMPEFSIPGMPEIPGFPFGNQETPSQPDGEFYQQGLGSGFVWDQEGYVVTNNHVVEGADKIELTFSDGTTVPAELVGTDPDSDLAVLKVDLPADQLKPVQIADSKQVKVGEMAIAIGNPFGLAGTMTVGIISAIGRTLPANFDLQGGASYSIPDVIQTDAPINPGNSGGVLVNEQGQVVGVTFAIESPTRSSAGIGFVIPSAVVQRVVPALIGDGRYEHPYLGISGTSLTPDLAEAMDLDRNLRGVLVSEVRPDGPAEKAGLEGSQSQSEIDGQEVPVGGDIIIAIDDQTVTGMDDIISYLANSTTVGQEVALTVLRDGNEMDLQVTLEARPDRQTEEASAVEPEPQASANRAFLGITGGTLTPEIAEAMDLPQRQEGVLVESVGDGSPAEEAGLQGGEQSFELNGEEIQIGGDVITAVDGEQVSTIQELIQMLRGYEPGDEVKLQILRSGQEMEISVTLGERPATQ